MSKTFNLKEFEKELIENGYKKYKASFKHYEYSYQKKFHTRDKRRRFFLNAHTSNFTIPNGEKLQGVQWYAQFNKNQDVFNGLLFGNPTKSIKEVEKFFKKLHKLMEFDNYDQ